MPVRGSGFPFQPFANEAVSFTDHLVFPSAAYDPYTGRLWVTYSEGRTLTESTLPPEVQPTCRPVLHLAVQKDLSSNPQTDFTDGQWWYYTGPFSDPPATGTAGHAFNLGLSPVQTGPQPFRDPIEYFEQHLPPTDTLDLPLLAFD